MVKFCPCQKKFSHLSLFDRKAIMTIPLFQFKRGDLVLVQTKCTKHHNQIKHSLAILKEFGETGPLQFAALEPCSTRPVTMTLRDYITGNEQALNFRGGPGVSFDDQLAETHNKHLVDLIATLPDLDKTLSDSSANECKIASLARLLMQSKPYLIIQSPEKDLNHAQLDLFTQALQTSIYSRKQITLIYSEAEDFWRTKACKIILEQGSFLQMIPLNQQKIRQKFIEQSPETSDKKTDQALTFHWPSPVQKKSA